MKRICIGLLIEKDEINIQKLEEVVKNRYEIKVYVFALAPTEKLVKLLTDSGIPFANVNHTDKLKAISGLLSLAKRDKFDSLILMDENGDINCEQLNYCSFALQANTKLAFAVPQYEYKGQLLSKQLTQNHEGVSITTTQMINSSDWLNNLQSNCGWIYDIELLTYIIDKATSQEYLAINALCAQAIGKIQVIDKYSYYKQKFDEIATSNNQELIQFEMRLQAITSTQGKISSAFTTALYEKELESICFLNKCSSEKINEILDKYVSQSQIFASLVETTNLELPSTNVLVRNKFNKSKSDLKNGVSFILVGDEILHTARVNNDFFKNSENIELIKCGSEDATSLNKIVGKCNFNRVIFLNEKYNLSKFDVSAFVKLVLNFDMKGNIYTLLHYDINSIRYKAANDLFLEENILLNNGNIFYATLFDTNHVLNIGFDNQFEESRQEFLINTIYENKYSIKLIQNFKLQSAYNMDNNSSVSPLAYYYLNQEQLQLLQCVKTSKSTNTILEVISLGKEYTCLSAIELNSHQLKKLKIQLTYLQKKQFDGVYFENQKGEIAGILRFDEGNEICLDNYVKVSVEYKNFGETTLYNLLKMDGVEVISDNSQTYLIEGYINVTFKQVSNRIYAYDNNQPRYINPLEDENGGKKFNKGLSIICFDGKFDPSFKKLQKVSAMEFIQDSNANLGQLIERASFNNIMFVSKLNYIDYDFNFEKLKYLVNGEGDIKVSQHREALSGNDGFVTPDVLANSPEEIYMGIVVSSQLLYGNTARVKSIINLMTLLCKKSLTCNIANYAHFGLKLNESKLANRELDLELSQYDKDFMLRLGDCLKAELNNKQEIAKSIEKNKWLYDVAEGTDVLRYYQQFVAKGQYEGLYVCDSRNKISNILLFDIKDNVNINNLRKIPVCINNQNMAIDQALAMQGINLKQGNNDFEYIDNGSDKLVIICSNPIASQTLEKLQECFKGEALNNELAQIKSNYEHKLLGKYTSYNWLYVRDDDEFSYNFSFLENGKYVLPEKAEKLDVLIKNLGFERGNVTIFGNGLATISSRLLAYQSEMITAAVSVAPCFDILETLRDEKMGNVALLKSHPSNSDTYKIVSLVSNRLKQGDATVDEIFIAGGNDKIYHQLENYENLDTRVYVDRHATKSSDVFQNNTREIYAILVDLAGKKRQRQTKHLKQTSILDIQLDLSVDSLELEL